MVRVPLGSVPTSINFMQHWIALCLLLNGFHDWRPQHGPDCPLRSCLEGSWIRSLEGWVGPAAGSSKEIGTVQALRSRHLPKLVPLKYTLTYTPCL